MGAPTTTALLLAALAALPCRGTNTDPVSANLDEATPTDGHPFVNKVYQMLFTNSPLDNHAFQTNTSKTTSNFTDDKSYLNINFNNSLTELSNDCCDHAQNVNNTINIGAVDREAYKDVVNVKRNRKRRVVKIDTSVRGEVTVRVTTVGVDVTAPPVLAERRRKPGETGSSTQLLNYIFDTYSNTHHHKNVRVGPGNSIYAAAAPEIEALTGSVANLDCKVDALHDKLVSWVRRKNDEEAMELLTTGTQQYTADDRYSARFIPPDIWRLEIKDVRPSDAAHYDCHLSAHPPRTARITLLVPEVSVRIVDGAGADVSEQVCEVGSTVALRCEVNGLKMEGGPSLLWYRRDYLLNDDTLRGGISVRTVFGQNGANSVLKVARVRGDDAGQYTCTVARAPPPAPQPAHVMLHVIKGESLAELHQGGSASLSVIYLPTIIITTLCANLIL